MAIAMVNLPTEDYMDKNRKLMVSLSICLGISLVGILVFQQVSKIPGLQTKKAILENELNEIQRPLGVTELEHFSRVKPEVVSVSRTYKTDLSYEFIRDYYINELSKQGWELNESKSLTVWGKDLGAKELIFTKNRYILKLDFPGHDPNFNYTFELTASWG